MGSVPEESQLSRGYAGGSQLGATGAAASRDHHSFQQQDGLSLRQNTASRPSSSYGKSTTVDHDAQDHADQYGPGENDLKRSTSTASTRGNTLKKKNSVSRKGSVKRSSSKRSLRAGSIKGTETAAAHRDASQFNHVFHTPIPTTGSPTEVLANRFGAWRKILKDLITYFREIQSSYEHRAKALLKVSNVINNIPTAPEFLRDGGLFSANHFLRDYHKQAIVEANKARDIQTDVVNHLNGLRQDLAAKIKEIKSLSGDFKNSVEKEKEGTKKVLQQLEEALQVADSDPAALVGKDDPFIVRMSVERQVERQIDEENYLHRAYLNLEGSGRELESIVVGEIQKAYNALAGILKREADEAYDTVEKLRSGPVALPKDHEWSHFVENDSHFVNPNLPLRKVEFIDYPGKSAPAAAEVRAGMLERKSKYLKSYTPGWYVLSPTHLHEFKSADRIYTQPPVMSLFLADQKLGSRSAPDGSSHKFMLKGKQTGSMHRGHSWVFRAESYDTMLAWYDDIKSLTETSPAERDAFVRKHARSVSVGSVSGESVMDEDEADQVPFSLVTSRDTPSLNVNHENDEVKRPLRPSPGRFPSDFRAEQYLSSPGNRAISPSSGSEFDDREQSFSSQSQYPHHSQGPVVAGIGDSGGGDIHRHQLHDNETQLNQQSPISPVQSTPISAIPQQGFQLRHQDQPLADGAFIHTANQHGNNENNNNREALFRGFGAGALAGGGLSALGIQQHRRRELDADNLVENGTSAHVATEQPVSLVSDAEKVATATALPPDILDPPITRPKDLFYPDMGTVESRSGYGGTNFVSAPGLSIAESNGSVSSPAQHKELMSVEDGGSQAGKEVVIALGSESTSAVSDSSASKPSGVARAIATPSHFNHTAYDTSPVDGHVNAKATGALFPRVLRHDTNVSVADLHIPGQWKDTT